MKGEIFYQSDRYSTFFVASEMFNREIPAFQIMNETRPIVSVIVPVWNGAQSLPGLLSALSKQDAAPHLFEIIVVDNGSTDESVAILAATPFITVLQEPEPGSYRARNRGVEAAEGDLLLFTDADCIPSADWVSHALEAATRNREFGIVGGAIEFCGGEATPALALYERLTSLDQRNYVSNGHCITANWLCHKSALLDVGAFNSELLSGGDLECSQRIARSGRAILFDAAMVVHHPVRASLSDLVSKRRRVVGGVWMITKHGSTLGGKLGAWWRCNMRFARSWGGLLIRLALREEPVSARLGAGVIASYLLGVSILETSRLALGQAPFRS